jgi:hypothetical protein
MSVRLFSLLAVGVLLPVSLDACSGAGILSRSPAPVKSSPARVRMTPRNGLEVIGAMRRAHPSRALRSIAFTVVTMHPRRDSARTRAVVALPGRFRMTLLPASRRTGSIRNQQHLAIFERGRRVATRERIDLATLLAYDVFAQGIDTTIRWLDVARVRYALARRDRLDGRDVWVVGAPEGDTVSSQFWVDEDTWRVVRVIQRDPAAPRKFADIRFPSSTEVMELPLPSRIEVYHDGELVERRVMTNVIVNPSVPSSAFDLTRWRDVRVGG